MKCNVLCRCKFVLTNFEGYEQYIRYSYRKSQVVGDVKVCMMENRVYIRILYKNYVEGKDMYLTMF